MLKKPPTMSASRVYGERLLRAAMRFHPRSFRRDYEHEMLDYYRAVMTAEGSLRGGVWRRWFLWKCIVSAVRRGWCNESAITDERSTTVSMTVCLRVRAAAVCRVRRSGGGALQGSAHSWREGRK